MNILFELLIIFAKIGLFTFGGGYAMISIIEDNCVEKKKWITHEEMMDITVIAESTPGPIAINCATFVGYKVAGYIGAILATIGVVLPSFIIILIISTCLESFLEISFIKNAFTGIKIGVGIIILKAGITMFKNMSKKLFSKIIMMFSFTIMFLTNLFYWDVSTITIMIVAAAISFVRFVIQESKKGRKDR